MKETFLEIWTGIPTWAKTLAVVAAIGFLTFFFSIDKGQYIPDNPAEEAVEAVIQITTGADVDLTPESEEKGWRWFS